MDRPDVPPAAVEPPGVGPGSVVDPFTHALLSGMQECACALDRDWKIVWANARAARQVGRSFDDTLGRSLLEIFPHALGTPTEAFVRRAMAGEAQAAEFLSPVSGRWIEMRALPVDGGGLVLVWRDLTERHREERARRRAAEERDAALTQLQAVLDVLPVGVGIAEDPECRVIRANPALARMMAAERGDNVSLSATDPGARPPLVVFQDGRLVSDDELPMQVAARTGLPAPPAKYTLVRPDGSRVVLSGAANPLCGPDGRATGSVGCFTDITAMEATLAAIGEQAAFLSAVGDTVPGMLFAAGPDGGFEYGNEALETFFGRRASELDLRVWWLAAHPDHAGGVEERWARVLDTGGPLELEYPIRRHDGDLRWFLVRARPHTEGTSRRWIGIALDVTERRRADEQLRDAQRLQAVGKLAGGVAHEVNNQMTVVLGMAGLAMRRLEVDHPARRAIEHIGSAGTRAANITRQLLAFSRRQVLQPVLIDANDLLLAFQPVLERIVGAHTAVVLDLAAGRPTVRADRGQLEQVLVNLACNSRDAMPGGGRLHLSTALVTDADVRRAVDDTSVRPGPWVAVSVADTGTGMTPDVRARAFEPFFSTRPFGEGTGLGLATVYGIVTQSGGHLAIESEPGAGTTLHLFLPAADAPPESIGPNVVLAPERPVRRARDRGRVVVAEDEPGVRELVRDVLAEAGFDVLAAPSGDHAARLLADLREPPALLVTDVVMPGMGGGELAARVRARWAVPVLFISGYAWEDVVRRGLLAEGVPFLQKPFEADTLLAKVRAVLDANRG